MRAQSIVAYHDMTGVFRNSSILPVSFELSERGLGDDGETEKRPEDGTKNEKLE